MYIEKSGYSSIYQGFSISFGKSLSRKTNFYYIIDNKC